MNTAIDDSRKLNRRIEFLFIVFVLGMLVIFGKLFYLQVIKYPFYKDKAQKMHLRTEKELVARGTIYDKAGIKLALSVNTGSVCACPKMIANKWDAAALLAPKLGMTFKEILSKINNKKEFVYIKRKVDMDLAQEITKLKINGIYIDTEQKRYYPFKEMCSQVLGFVGTEHTGLEGIEAQYDKYLRGKTGLVMIKKDAKGRPVLIDTVDVKSSDPGADLYLTIDSNVQYQAQKEIDDCTKKYNAKSGTIIVMNPNTGAILAMANYPTYDPNNFLGTSRDKIRNVALTDVFEPGSTFKIFTMAAFLKDFPDSLNEKVFCGNGKYLFFDRYVHDDQKNGWLTIPEIIKYSSNIGMVYLALKLSQEKLYNEYCAFGFGKPTGIDLPGETCGILRNYKDWDNTTMTSIPYGQEVAATSMQIARAYAAVANGGYLVKPYVVEKMVKNGNVIYEHSVQKSGKILSEDQRQKLITMMKMVVEKGGSGQKAFIDSYEVAGKTGTAQKHDPSKKGYLPGKYVASFVGFLPADKPEILTFIMVNEPHPAYYGGDVAAPVFKAINEAAISYMHIAPSEKQNIEPAENTEIVEIPDFSMKKYNDVKTFLSRKKINYKAFGFGHFVIGQEPQAKAKISGGETLYILLGDMDKNNNLKVYMPDLRGCTVRMACEILEKMGVKIKCVGSGIAVGQDPKAGVAVEKGKSCTVSFDTKSST